MSTHSYAVSDKGLAVKIQEIDVEKFREYIKEKDGIELEPDEGEDIYDAIRQYICDDSQYYLKENWEQGVICHKWSYGNDIYGDFTPLIKDINEIDVDVENDDWVLMCLPRYASLFEQAYESEETLISEMKLLYGNFLPKDFDYRARLASLCAVVWG